VKGKTDRDQSLERQAKEIISRKRVTMPTKTVTTDSEAKRLIRQKDNNQIRAPRKETVAVDRKNIRLYSKSPDVFTARPEKLCNNYNSHLTGKLAFQDLQQFLDSKKGNTASQKEKRDTSQERIVNNR
jgi:hypothetical protein